MGARTIDEGGMDEKSGMNFSEYMAILSGNTDLLDKAKLDKKITALEGERKSFNTDKAISARKLDDAIRSRDGNNERISRMSSDYEKFISVAQKDKEGNFLNPIKLDGLASADMKRIGTMLQEIAKNTNTLGEYKPIGELYGFKLLVKSETIISTEGERRENRFFAEGQYKYSYNNGHIAMADTKAAATNFLKALERIPQLVEQYQKGNQQYERDIPILQEIVKGTWKKEDELKQLKTESAALERKIQLSLKPAKEETPNEQNSQQIPQKKNSNVNVGNSERKQLPSLSESLDKQNVTARQNDNKILVVRPDYGEKNKGLNSAGIKM